MVVIRPKVLLCFPKLAEVASEYVGGIGPTVPEGAESSGERLN